MNCRRFEDLREEFLDGTLLSGERAAAVEHLASCRVCAEAFRRRQQFGGHVAETFQQAAQSLRLQPDVERRIVKVWVRESGRSRLAHRALHAIRHLLWRSFSLAPRGTSGEKAGERGFSPEPEPNTNNSKGASSPRPSPPSRRGGRREGEEDAAVATVKLPESSGRTGGFPVRLIWRWAVAAIFVAAVIWMAGRFGSTQNTIRQDARASDEGVVIEVSYRAPVYAFQNEGEFVRDSLDYETVTVNTRLGPDTRPASPPKQ